MNGDIIKKSKFQKELREIVFTASEADSTDGGDSSHSSSPQPDELGELRSNGSVKKLDHTSSSEGSLQIREASNERLDLDFLFIIILLLFYVYLTSLMHIALFTCTSIASLWLHYIIFI